MPTVPIEIAGHRIGVPATRKFRERNEPFFWPLVGDYPIYDKYIYAVMTADEDRAAAYHQAVAQVAGDRIAVEIGTGDQAHWAIACAKAGAKHVYAIEENREALRKAAEIISREGVSDRITLIPGISAAIDLPEKADLSISEVIGEIGGSEGAVSILNDVRRRFLNPGATCVPWKCLSYCSPVQLPDPLQQSPVIERMGLSYVEKIFALAKRPFDLRLSIDNCFAELEAGMLSRPQILESLDFDDFCEENWTRNLSIEIETPGIVDGLLVWIELSPGRDTPVLSSLTPGSNWRPVFCPLFSPGIKVDREDTVSVEWSTKVSRDGYHPDYHITCSVHSAKKNSVVERSTLNWPNLPNSVDCLHQNGFYRHLLPLT